jgi:hypothetical protein
MMSVIEEDDDTDVDERDQNSKGVVEVIEKVKVGEENKKEVETKCGHAEITVDDVGEDGFFHGVTESKWKQEEPKEFKGKQTKEIKIITHGRFVFVRYFDIEWCFAYLTMVGVGVFEPFK